jgi:phosphatidylglycerol:prolipoprotein diacylglycerol transferase
MYPVLLSIGSWKLYANFAFFVLSCIIGIMVGIREVSRSESFPRYSKLQLILFFIGGILFAYLAGRLNGGLYGLVYSGGYLNELAYGGFISFGAILGTFLYGFLFSKIFHVPSAEILDLIALILSLMESVYRVGCLLTGCCYGRATAGFGGVYLPEIHGVWAYRYPTQLMLIVFSLILFLWLWRRRTKKIRAGSQAIYFLLIYCLGRFLIDFFRGDMPIAWNLGFQQIESLVIFILTIIFILLYRGFSCPLKK